jgi:membrane-associated phospholipid phosphatase
LDNTKRISYNPYFIYPFLAWMAAGAIALANMSKHDLFFAINTHYSDTGDVFMYYVTWLGQAEVIIPALLLLLFIPRLRNWWYFLTALACNVIPFIVQHFIKSWLNYPRPLLLYSNTPGVHYRPEWPELLHTSFPSGHSQGAFSFFCFLSLLLPARFRVYGFVFFLMGMMVCYSRIYLAAHFFSDVYAGSLLGVTLTTLIFAIMSNFKGSLIKQEAATA